MAKKSFFKERSIARIKKLHTSRAYKQYGLVEKINGLDPSEEGIIIKAQIVPGRFFINVKNGAQASRKCYHHGGLIALSHPETKEQCYNSNLTPLQLREQAFSKLEKIKEDEIYFTGFSFQPGWGDRTKRIVPLVWCPEAERLFAYAENMTNGIKVKPYKDSKKVKIEGASVVLEVPSRKQKKPRYQFKLLHVPILRSQYNLASVLSIKPALIYDESREPKSDRVAHDLFNIRYTWEKQREGSNVITFYPQDIAGYLGIIKEAYKTYNLTPLEMNPFALFSRKGTEFYKKLCNNILIYDPSLKSKGKLRKPHISEKSILLARAIGKFGHNEIAYWDPSRDGKIKDYDWAVKID